MSAPAILVALPLLAGSAAAVRFFDAFDDHAVFICAGAALLTLIAGVGAALLRDGPEACTAVVLGFFLTGLSLGATAAHRAYGPTLLEWYDEVLPTEPVAIEGVLRDDAAPTPLGVSITVDVSAVGSSSRRGGVRLSIGGVLHASNIAEWRAGRKIRAPAFLRRPSVYLNPGTPDERRPLARRGIVLVGSVKSAALIEIVSHGTWISEAAGALRAGIRGRIARHIAPIDSESAGIAAAILIGDRTGLSEEDERRLQEAGTYHVIAISGGNIAILAVLVLLGCRLFCLTSRTAALVTAVVILFYGVVAGGAASVARAVTVAVIVLAARAMDHRGPSLNVLAIAAAFAVAWSPVVVFDAGFLLSFGATLGILLGVPVLVRQRSPSSSRPRRLIGRLLFAVITLFAATIAAEVALAPTAATLFSRVTFAGLLLNFAAIPLMTIVQIGGLIVVTTSSLSETVADAAARASHFAAAGLLQSTRLVALAPWTSLDVPPPAWGVIVGYYACALGLLVSRARRVAAPALAAIAAVMLIGPTWASRDAVPAPHMPLRVVMLDVGQGDATVVSLPSGRTLLVDAGGLFAFGESENAAGFDVGERVVMPALRALGITRLDALVVTHGDPDHVQGARGVLRHVRARGIWDGVPVPRYALLQDLAQVALTSGLTWRTVQAGDRERFGDVEVRVLHPPPPEWERQRVRNEDSVVLEVRIGRASIVLPGDIGAEGERAILPRLDPDRLVILKAPHHGSATSSTKALLDALRPAAVVFSCGRNNRFGHPHPSVVARYREIRAEIFSTASDGAVFVETDGTTVDVRGWAGRRARFRVTHQ